MHRIDGEGATVDNKFTEGNPSTGVLATTVTADWANAIQEEIVAVILASGQTLVKTNNGQLLAAIQSLISGGGVAVTAAGVSVEDLGGYFTTDNVEAALQQLAAKLYAGTINSNQVRRGVLYLDGTAFQTEVAHSENYLIIYDTSLITYTVRPDAELNLPLGTAIQIGQGAAGQVQVVGGAGVTIFKAASFNAKTLEQNAIIALIKTGPNQWQLGGMLEAA